MDATTETDKFFVFLFTAILKIFIFGYVGYVSLVVEQGLLSSCAWTSHCCGFSCGVQAIRATSFSELKRQIPALHTPNIDEYDRGRITAINTFIQKDIM